MGCSASTAGEKAGDAGRGGVDPDAVAARISRRLMAAGKLTDAVQAFETSVLQGEPRWDLDLTDEQMELVVDAAYEELREQLDLAVRRHDDAHAIKLWRVVRVRGILYGMRGDADREEAEYVGAVGFCRQAKCGGLDLGECLCTLGKFYEDKRGDYKKAEEQYHQAADEVQKSVGNANHPGIVRPLQLLADMFLYRVKARYSEAAFLYERVLGIVPADSMTATEVKFCLFECAAHGKGASKKAEAARWGKAAVAAYEEQLGAQHQRTLFVVSEVRAWAAANGAPL